LSGGPGARGCLAGKYYSWDLTQYDAVLVLDADTLVLNNMVMNFMRKIPIV